MADRREKPELVEYKKLPWGIWLLERLGLCSYGKPLLRYKVFIFVWTFFIYTSYHLSRKPFSVVKVTLCPVCANCSSLHEFWNGTEYSVPGWAPFNDIHNGKTFLGSVDYSWLFSYAVFIFFSGYLADRLNLRYFLTLGMMGSGVTVFLLGVAYFANIHHLLYFIVVQVFGGALQSTGWPGVVALMSNWFGKHNRGLIMGIWNSHTSVGNILGTIIPSFWAECGDQKPWGWSFFIPGAIIFTFGIVTYFILVTSPTHVGLPPPTHHTEEDLAVLSEIKKQKKKPVVSYNVVSSNGGSDVDHLSASPTQQQHKNGGEGVWRRFNSDHKEVGVADDHKDGDQMGLLKDIDEWEEEEEEKGSGAEEKKKEVTSTEERDTKEKAVTFFQALAIPGVLEFSFSLFFDKLVSYTFLYWLPLYVKYTREELSGPESDWLSTLFDVGGILGGIVAGVISDKLNARAVICVIFLVLAVPFLFILRSFGDGALWVYILLLVMNGVFINGPYSIITTAVSSDLGTHPSLKSNQNAKAIVTAIIDGTGSMGAALGPLLVGIISDHSSWTNVFYFLMACCIMSALLLSRLVYKEVLFMYYRYCKRFRKQDQLELRNLNALDGNMSESSISDSEH